MIFATLLMLADAISSTPEAADAAPVAKVESAKEPVRCVREDIIGSLARKVKTCHTEREWSAIRGDAETEARRMAVPTAPEKSN